MGSYNHHHLPLNVCNVKKNQLIINRLHLCLHGTALLALFYYRIKTIFDIFFFETGQNTLLPHSLLFLSELVLSFIWLLSQPSKWKPVARTVHPESLPVDDELPPIDVFVCTSDPTKEPCLQVMNTVVSALALDYPPRKLHVYLSDDGGSPVTLRATKQAWRFSRFWVPFCRKFKVKNRCPEAFFHRQQEEKEESDFGSDFFAQKRKIQERYEEFKNSLAKIASETSAYMSRDHPSLIEVISDENGNEDMPVLVYVAREKRPSHPHNFKAGALNVLLRLSAVISNSPYILVLDCDMYCNDPSSARQAMCFHLDSKLSQNLAFVQFPQKFHNISETDIYDGQLRCFWPKFEGWDGLRGPPLSGTCFYIKREALCKTREFRGDVDLIKLDKCFGSSKEFIKSIIRNHKPDFPNDIKKLSDNALQEEFRSVASCRYDNGTKWGKEVGFRYFSVVEDLFTGFNLHCEGWTSVYMEPSRPCFLGSSPITLSELLVQHTRWYVGLSQIALSRFSPLLYGPKQSSIAQTMIYAEFVFNPFYFLPLYILALVPQLCLLRDIPLYPQVSSPYFVVFVFVFLSAQMIHVQEILSTGHSIRAWSNELRIWTMKSLTSYLYATIETVVEKTGLRKSSFLPTNKVVDDEQVERYRVGIYDFQASPLFMVPLCALYMLSAVSFVVGVGTILHSREKGNEMVMQILIALFAVVLHFPLLEGMVLRKDKGRMSPSVSLVAAAICIFVVSCASLSC